MEGDSFMRTVGRMKMLLLWRSLDASSFVCHLFIATVIQEREVGWVFSREILHRHVFFI